MALLGVFWTKTAIDQRNYIFQYWNTHNKSTSYSQKLNKRIKERIEILKSHPGIGKKTTFASTRILSLGHYSILYQHINKQIIITGFWDNRQNPAKLLSFLKDKEL